MNTSLPRFLKLIRRHNQHALWLSFVSLLGAVLLWVLVVFFVILILLGLTTSVRGDWGDGIPAWILIVTGVAAAGLFVWGAVDRWMKRFSPVTDRPIIGWHLIPDALLLPVRVTFGIWGNLGAMVILSNHRKLQALETLLALAEMGKVHGSERGQLDADLQAVDQSLSTLQILGLVDRYPSDDDVVYLVNHYNLERLTEATPG